MIDRPYPEPTAQAAGTLRCPLYRQEPAASANGSHLKRLGGTYFNHLFIIRFDFRFDFRFGFDPVGSGNHHV